MKVGLGACVAENSGTAWSRCFQLPPSLKVESVKRLAGALPDSGKSEGSFRQLGAQDPRRAEATVRRKECTFKNWPSNGDFSPGLVPRMRGQKRAEAPARKHSVWQGTRFAFQVGPTKNIARSRESKGQKATLSWDEDNRT